MISAVSGSTNADLDTRCSRRACQQSHTGAKRFGEQFVFRLRPNGFRIWANAASFPLSPPVRATILLTGTRRHERVGAILLREQSRLVGQRHFHQPQGARPWLSGQNRG